MSEFEKRYFWPDGFVELQVAVSRFPTIGADHLIRTVILHWVQLFRIILSCCRTRIDEIKSARVGKIVGILLVCAEAQIGNYVRGIFLRIKW